VALIGSKWPLLLVTGKPVTPEQADDILLRSNGPYFTTNDRAWERQLAGILGIEMTTRTYGNGGGEYLDMSWQASAEWFKRIGGVELHYIGNRRIVSSWIGGPKGWCDWDGRIGCGNWNIGKWPSVPEVEEDLTAIAAAWPFLDMRVQLVEDEGDGSLCGEWRVLEGKSMETEPGPRITEADFDMAGAVAGILFGQGRERGVSPERLASAYARVMAGR
jgi:hypothetical protein